MGLWDPAYVKHNYNNMSQFIINKLAQMGWSSKAPRDTNFWKNPLQSSGGMILLNWLWKKLLVQVWTQMSLAPSVKVWNVKRQIGWPMRDS
jgi:hypothetical protein